MVVMEEKEQVDSNLSQLKSTPEVADEFHRATDTSKNKNKNKNEDFLSEVHTFKKKKTMLGVEEATVTPPQRGPDHIEGILRTPNEVGGDCSKDKRDSAGQMRGSTEVCGGLVNEGVSTENTQKRRVGEAEKMTEAGKGDKKTTANDIKSVVDAALLDSGSEEERELLLYSNAMKRALRNVNSDDEDEQAATMLAKKATCWGNGSDTDSSTMSDTDGSGNDDVYGVGPGDGPVRLSRTCSSVSLWSAGLGRTRCTSDDRQGAVGRDMSDESFSGSSDEDDIGEEWTSMNWKECGEENITGEFATAALHGDTDYLSNGGATIISKKRRPGGVGIRKKYLDPEVKEILKEWLFSRPKNPHPNEEELLDLCKKTGLTRKVVSQWFRNSIRNLLIKHVDSNGEVSYSQRPLKVRRSIADLDSKGILAGWMAKHSNFPYPSRGEKIELGKLSDLSKEAVDSWFYNARRESTHKAKPNAQGDVKNESGGAEGTKADKTTLESNENMSAAREEMHEEVLNGDNKKRVALKKKTKDGSCRRESVDKGAPSAFKEWLVDHLDNPFPSESEVSSLADQLGMTAEQVTSSMRKTRKSLLMKARSKAQTQYIVKPKPQRTMLKPDKQKILIDWLFAHLGNPYPSLKEKREMCKLVDVEKDKLDTWFGNARRDLLYKDEFGQFCVRERGTRRLG
eukprot:Nk52_evm13s301 gene=Nk52_evmTU13s301